MKPDVSYGESELNANTSSTLTEEFTLRLKNFYYRLVDPIRRPARIEREYRKFVDTFFDSAEVYRSVVNELHHAPQSDYIRTAIETQLEHREISRPRHTYMAALYAYIRKHSPEVVVETGVRDGWSTLYALLALEKNNTGTLYSIDYPVYSDDPDADESPFPAIPAGKQPGWIIPDDLTDCWELTLGRSQRELPALASEVEPIDIFVHDSEHTLPCLLFEMDLAWEFLSPGGIVFVDDVRQMKLGFDAFVREREANHGLLKETGDFGYVVKRSDDS